MNLSWYMSHNSSLEKEYFLQVCTVPLDSCLLWQSVWLCHKMHWVCFEMYLPGFKYYMKHQTYYTWEICHLLFWPPRCYNRKMVPLTGRANSFLEKKYVFEIKSKSNPFLFFLLFFLPLSPGSTWAVWLIPSSPVLLFFLHLSPWPAWAVW